MEDVHRLLQLLTDRRHHRREDFYDARRAESRPAEYGTNTTCHASYRCSRYRCAQSCHFDMPVDPIHSPLGLLCDLLWSDPDKDITGWSENDRGVSFTFGPDVVSRFLQKHDMDLICRAHQVSFVLSMHIPVSLIIAMLHRRSLRMVTNSLRSDSL